VILLRILVKKHQELGQQKKEFAKAYDWDNWDRVRAEMAEVKKKMEDIVLGS